MDVTGVAAVARHRIHIFCCRDCLNRAFQQLRGRKVGVEDTIVSCLFALRTVNEDAVVAQGGIE